MNVKVAICDDMEYFIDQIKDFSNEYANKQKIYIEITSFSDPEILLKQIEMTRYDIFILDIEMPGITGIELGRRIKEKDEDAVIIYVTSYQDYAFDAMQIEIAGFILKPSDEGRFTRVMDRAVMMVSGLQEQIQIENQYLKATVEYEKIQIYVKDIAVIEKQGNSVVITMRNGREHKYYTTLKKIEEKLSRKRFLKISNSCYVHIAYVKGLDDQCVVMPIGSSDKYYPISRKAQKSVDLEVKRMLAKKRSLI